VIIVKLLILPLVFLIMALMFAAAMVADAYGATNEDL